jgi:hypothetical protein
VRGCGTVERGSGVLVELWAHVIGKSILSNEVVFSKFGLTGIELPLFDFLDHLMG